jgi:hypothetical protein
MTPATILSPATIHLSALALNPRSRQARKDIGSPYELHSTLLRAFERGGGSGATPGEASARAGRLLFRVERPRPRPIGASWPKLSPTISTRRRSSLGASAATWARSCSLWNLGPACASG